MRFTIIWLLIGHALFLILTLGFVTFKLALSQAFFIIILYSLYLNLKKWILYVYLVIIAINAVIGFLNMWFFEGIGLLIYVLLVIFYALGAYKLFIDTHDFRGDDAASPEAREEFLARYGMNHMYDNVRG